MKKKILIVYASYYKDISDNLLYNALEHLKNTYNLNIFNSIDETFIIFRLMF